MLSARLPLAFESGLELPEAGRIAVFAPRAGTDLSALPKERVRIITGFKPDYDHFAGLGFDCAVAPDGRFALSLVCLPRAKLLARALLAQAAAVTDGQIVVDGGKTDGVESVLKDCRKRANVSAPVSKAHGKIFWFAAGNTFADWQGAPQEIEGGFVTAPGVFSADGIDPGSALLAEHLPQNLGRQVADLGGGWGYLSARALEREEIEALYLIDADHAACACARQNVTDARVQVIWEDATRWQPPVKLDAVISNPPFHSDRAADPGLGRAFIAAAAGMLAPNGQFWMVANRHLPYEDTLARYFARVDEVAGNTKFKILHAARPARQPR